MFYKLSKLAELWKSHALVPEASTRPLSSIKFKSFSKKGVKGVTIYT